LGGGETNPEDLNSKNTVRVDLPEAIRRSARVRLKERVRGEFALGGLLAEWDGEANDGKVGETRSSPNTRRR